jgi:NAD(P)-dependent dehydrogenase (short-subunit alcohol dehydrogenase family)
VRFQERVTIITGSGSGLRRVLAHRFAAEGAAVVVADVVGQRATTVALPWILPIGHSQISVKTRKSPLRGLVRF